MMVPGGTKTDPRAAWHAWRSRSAMRMDPLANYEFGLKVGQRLAIERTTGIVPLLEDLRDYLGELAVGMGNTRADLTGVDGSGHGGAQTAHAVPDLTVGSPGVVQVDAHG
jgi:hypothetical protein